MEKPLQVLFIDDSEDDIIPLLRELRRNGYDPLYQRVDTEAALRAALNVQGWDVVLSDYNVPQFGIPRALSVLKEKALDLPFIIVSEAIGEENAAQLMREGARDYVMKGNLQRLIPVIERELREAEESEQRKSAQDLLRKSGFIVNASHDMMGLVNRDHVYEAANKSLCRVFGRYDPTEIIGHHISDIWGQEFYRKTLKDTLEQCLRGEELECEVWFRPPGTHDQCFEIAYTPYQDSNDTVTHVIMVAHIITARKKTEEELATSYAKLQQTLEETVHALSALVEMRDPYTAGHQNRVAKIALAVAQRLGLSEDTAKSIWIASLVHDIGKICVPSDILAKPRRLSPLEFELIREHPQAAYDILKGIDFHWPVADIVLQHHERLNGTGYPHGLAGNSILFESRIIGVADVVEAMTYQRPYREALGLDAALCEIKEQRGILYDPEVVDTCVAIFCEDGFTLE